MSDVIQFAVGGDVKDEISMDNIIAVFHRDEDGNLHFHHNASKLNDSGAFFTLADLTKYYHERMLKEEKDNVQSE